MITAPTIMDSAPVIESVAGSGFPVDLGPRGFRDPRFLTQPLGSGPTQVVYAGLADIMGSVGPITSEGPPLPDLTTFASYEGRLAPTPSEWPAATTLTLTLDRLPTGRGPAPRLPPLVGPPAKRTIDGNIKLKPNLPDIHPPAPPHAAVAHNLLGAIHSDTDPVTEISVARYVLGLSEAVWYQMDGPAGQGYVLRWIHERGDDTVWEVAKDGHVRASLSDADSWYMRREGDDVQPHHKLIGDSEEDAAGDTTGSWISASIIADDDDNKQLKFSHVGPGASCYCTCGCTVTGMDLDAKGHVRGYYDGCGGCSGWHGPSYPV